MDFHTQLISIAMVGNQAPRLVSVLSLGVSRANLQLHSATTGAEFETMAPPCRFMPVPYVSARSRVTLVIGAPHVALPQVCGGNSEMRLVPLGASITDTVCSFLKTG